jgi:predicted amidohydrolase
VGYREYAPTKLVVFPEVFMQGWIQDPSPSSGLSPSEKVVKEMAIEIPGEETDLLAEKARQYGIYISGTAHEVIPEIGTDLAFNCAFIIDPKGEVIYKHHKYCPYLPYRPRDDASPHDVWDRYIEVMDGKYGRKKGDILSCMFPVIDTDIGRLGCVICNEGFYSEHSRAIALQGCEVMLRSSGILEPEGSLPQQQWEITNRAAGVFNMMYVVACAPGDMYVKGNPVNYCPGQSMIVDFHGALLQHVPYPGETVTGAVINIEALRRRRMDPRHNWLTQLRTEDYKEMYAKPIYPINLFRDGPPKDSAERSRAQPVKRFLEEGIFVPPSQSS